MPSILNYSENIAIPCSGYHYYEQLSLTVQCTLYTTLYTTVHCILYRNGEWLVTELSQRPRSEKFTLICTINENFLIGPIGCQSVYTYCTFLLTSEANQYSKQPLEKY